MTFREALLPAFALSLLSSSAHASAARLAPASAWEIGPVIAGRNYSLGLARPTTTTDGWAFSIGPRHEPHYVTFRHGSLRGKTRIRMRFRIDGPASAIVYGAKCATAAPAAVTLFFQRRDDDWRRDGGRWWASFASMPLTGPSREREVVAALDGRWTSVMTMSAANSPAAFAAAKAQADRVGFTFANCTGLGHGARATVPVRFVVTHFEVL